MYACMLVYLRQTYADKYGKEKEEHTRQWGQYQPHRNYVERNTFVVPKNECYEVCLKRVPQFRQRWGYQNPLETVMFEDQRYKYGWMSEVQDYHYDSD